LHRAPLKGALSISVAGKRVGTIVTLCGKKREPLYIMAILAALFQFLDAFVGIYEWDIAKVAGPLLLAFLGFIFTYYASKSKAAT
jgi:hypothetical protein